MRNVGVSKYSGAKDRVHVYGGSGGGGGGRTPMALTTHRPPPSTWPKAESVILYVGIFNVQEICKIYEEYLDQLLI